MKTKSFLSSRNIGLDLLRAGLIIEGVLLHASRSLPGENSWIYNSQRDPSTLFTALLSLIHTFRMEVFFFLSGMFSALIILRKGRAFFHDNRRKRVLLPLLSAYIIIPPLMYCLEKQMSTSVITLKGVLESYATLHHLWFLVSLSIMSLLIPNRFYQWCARYFAKMPLPFLIALLIVLGNLFFVLKFLTKGQGDFINLIPVTARFLVYYTAGYALYIHRGNISCYSNSIVMNGGLIAALAMAIWLGFFMVAEFHIEGAMKYLPTLAGSVFSVLLSYWLVFKFEKIQIKENRMLTTIIDSALVIYLLHYPVVIAFSWLLDTWLPAQFSIIYVLIDFVIGIAVSVMCYFLIKQSHYASFIFGVKPKMKKFT